MTLATVEQEFPHIFFKKFNGREKPSKSKKDIKFLYIPRNLRKFCVKKNFHLFAWCVVAVYRLQRETLVPAGGLGSPN
jgi:hypothetical protein